MASLVASRVLPSILISDFAPGERNSLEKIKPNQNAKTNIKRGYVINIYHLFYQHTLLTYLITLNKRSSERVTHNKRLQVMGKKLLSPEAWGGTLGENVSEYSTDTF